MKKLSTIFFIILFCSFLPAKEKLQPVESSIKPAENKQAIKNDSINISEMVQKQIDSARQKEIWRGELKSEAAIMPILEVNAKSIMGLNPLSFLSSVYFGKVFILLYASIIVSVFIAVRRFKNKKNNSSRNLKNAINILRNEVAVNNQNLTAGRKGKKLEKLRRKIYTANELNNYGEEEIIRTAKKLHISKGELMLAVKIKSHQLNGNYSTKMH